MTEKDIRFLEFVVEQTRLDKIRWEITADPTKFVASLRGKFKITIDRSVDEDDHFQHFLTLLDDADRELLVLWGHDNPKVHRLFDLARRNSLSVDKVLDEIMGGEEIGEIKDEDIPF